MFVTSWWRWAPSRVLSSVSLTLRTSSTLHRSYCSFVLLWRTLFHSLACLGFLFVLGTNPVSCVVGQGFLLFVGCLFTQFFLLMNGSCCFKFHESPFVTRWSHLQPESAQEVLASARVWSAFPAVSLSCVTVTGSSPMSQ